MFIDDSNFRKAKRALLITASISFLIGFAGIDVKELNFAIVKFNIENPYFINHFLVVVLLYQLVIFYLRARKYFSTTQLNENKEIAEIYKSGKTPAEYDLEIKGYKENLVDFEKRINELAEKGNLVPREDYSWKTKEDFQSKSGYVKETSINAILKLLRLMQSVKKRIVITEKIKNDSFIIASVNKQEKILEYYLPLIFCAISLVIVEIPFILKFLE